MAQLQTDVVAQLSLILMLIQQALQLLVQNQVVPFLVPNPCQLLGMLTEEPTIFVTKAEVEPRSAKRSRERLRQPHVSISDHHIRLQ